VTHKQEEPRLLVTGASGVFGWTLCGVAAQTWDVIGTVWQHPVERAGAAMRRIDLTNTGALVDLFAAVRPHGVVHAAALSSADYCQSHVAESENVNVTVSAHIATLCAQAAIPCVFTSTDLVFDGEHAPYDEDSAAQPISVYGEHKLRAEAVIRARHPRAVVCRLPLMFGTGSPAAGGFFRRMLQSMAKGDAVQLFVDEFRTPVSTETAAQGVLMALRQAEGMTLHLGGPERVSRYELGRIAASVFGLGQARLVESRQKDVALPAPRPRDVALDSRRAERIGYRPASIREQMIALRAMLQ
jgi:dTDP-4-dehydrorhamnose reductase